MALPVFAQDQAPDTQGLHQPEAARPEAPAPKGDRAWMRAERMAQFYEKEVPREEMAKPHQERTDAWRIGIGVVPLEDVIRVHLQIPDDRGVMVKEVMPNGPADKARIKENDIILQANDQPIASLEQLREVVNDAGKKNASIRLLVIQGGKRGEVTIENDSPKRDQQPKKEMSSPQLPRQFGSMMDPMMMGELRGQISNLTDRLEKQQREIEELKKMVRERLRNEDRKEKFKAQKKEKLEEQ